MIITKRYDWCMGHRLPNHDGKCFRLHGHQYTAEIDIEGLVQGNTGMVLDFYLIKKAIEEQIGDWDHRTMLWAHDEMLVSTLAGHKQDVHFGVFRVPFIPTAENIATEILQRLRLVDLNVVRVRVYETPDGWAEARYV